MRERFGTKLMSLAFVALSSLVHEIAPQHAEWDLRWLNVLRTVVVTFALAYFWRGYGELSAIGDVKPHQWLLAIGSGLVVFVVWIRFDHGWAVFGSTRGIRSHRPRRRDRPRPCQPAHGRAGPCRARHVGAVLAIISSPVAGRPGIQRG